MLKPLVIDKMRLPCLKVSRHPVVIDATNKLEEALRLLQYIQDAGVVKSTKTKTAIYELLTKV